MEIRLLAKLIERLHNLGRSEAAQIGFGRPVKPKQKPALLVIGETSSKQIKTLLSKGGIEHLDAVLVTDVPSDADAKSLGDVIWGARVSDIGEKELDKLKEAGCDFILVESVKASAAVLRDDGMARGRELPLDISERQARVLDDLPFDFLTLKYSVKPDKLTVAELIEFQAAVSMVGKHIVLEVSELPSKTELNLLKDMPVDALIVQAGGMTAKQGKSIREAIDVIEPRKPRSHHDDPAIAQSGTSVVDAEGHEDGFDDDDDDDDDDFDA